MAERIKKIRKPEDVVRLSTDLVDFYKEHFVVFFLDIKNKVLAREVLSVGSLNATIVHPREVFRAAIERSAASIICVHNHPSGDPTPSQEDIRVTRRLVEVGETIGIEMIDHIILGKNGYCSLKQDGFL